MGDGSLLKTSEKPFITYGGSTTMFFHIPEIDVSRIDVTM
jgi:hypothetical protein